MQKPMQQTSININPNDLQNIMCSNNDCLSKNFIQVYQMKKISALISPDGQEQIVTIPVFICNDCGTEMPGQRVGDAGS